MRCPSCQSENPEHARFCGECGAGLGPSGELAQCSSCGFLNPAGAKFCNGCGLARSAAPQAGERKIVTVLFSDVSGFTALSETLDPEELRDLMDGWFARLGEIVRRFGGTIDKFIGDAVMVLFGAPVAHEDDPRRAIDAALAIHEALGRYNRDVERRIGRALEIRVGINTGRVYAGMIGGAANRAYTVMGDAVNVASRMETACPVGSILVSASTYRHVRGLYDVRALEPIAVKGKSDPIAAFEVLGRKPQAAAQTSMSLQQLGTRGRDAEVGVLLDAYHRAKHDGDPSLVITTGDVGIGKSSFLRDGVFELAKRVRLGRLLSARCTADSGAGPFQVLAEWLRNAAEVPTGAVGRGAAERVEGYLKSVFRPREVDEIIRVLSRAIGLTDVPLGPPAHSDDPQTLHHETLEAVREWIAALAEHGPTVIRVDNLHHAPDATAELFRHLLAAKLPLVIVAGARTDGAGVPEPWRSMQGSRHLPLGPLSHAAAVEVATALLRPLEQPSPLLVERLAQRSGGNPSYIEETIRALIDEGIIAEDATTGKWRLTCGDALPDPLPVPDTVGQMVQARIDRLPPLTKRALQWAAVAGERFWPAMLAAIAVQDRGYPLGVSEIELAMSEPLETGLIVEAAAHAPDGGAVFRFRQSLIREIVYDTITNKLRREWHAALARWRLEQAGSAEELQPAALDAIAHHLVCAGDHAGAAVLYRQAGDAARAVWANRDARVRYQRARDCQARAGAPAGERVEVNEALGDMCGVDGDYGAAIAAYDDALELAESPEDRARLLIARGRACNVGREDARARASFEEAIATVEAPAAPTDETRRLLASALQNLGWSRYQAGDYDGAEQLYARGLEICEQIEAPLVEASLEDARGTIARTRGDLDGAIAAKRRALELRYQVGDKRKLATSYINLGSVLFTAGDHDAARDAFEQSLKIHEETGNAEGIGIACANLGAAELELGILPAAQAHLERSVGVARHSGAWYAPDCYRYLAEVVMRTGNLPRAAQLVAEGMDLADKGGVAEFRGALLAVRGEILSETGNTADAARSFDEAVTALESADAVFELGVTLYRYGQMLRGEDEGRRKLERARELFASVGNVTWRDRADEALARL